MSFNPGSTVLVQWSDGNRYEGKVMQEHGAHLLIAFPNGQQQWIEQRYVSAAGGGPVNMGALQAAEGALEVEGGIVVYGSAQEYWNELQQVVARVEGQRIPLCGVDPGQPVTFWHKFMAIQRAEQQGMPRAQAVRQEGFHDEEHLGLIQEYVFAKWAYMGTDDEGRPAVLSRDEYTNAQIEASMGQMQQAQRDAASADPNLLAPVHGVSLEQWARASVALGSLGEGATPEDAARKLAELGLDRATYDAASAGWQAKMQGDTTAVIATKFGEAFAAAQGMQGGWQMGGAQAGGAQGEPCSFEHYCEIMAAMGAWSEQGYDVNAKMKEVFGIDAMEYSRLSSHWAMKMASDIALMNKQQELDARFRQKYAGAGLDDDLSL